MTNSQFLISNQGGNGEMTECKSLQVAGAEQGEIPRFARNDRRRARFLASLGMTGAGGERG